MENLYANMHQNGTTLETDRSFRLPLRPQGSQPVTPSPSTFGDEGSTLRSPRNKGSKKARKNTGQTTIRRPTIPSKDHDCVSSDDQLDSLSEASPKKKKPSKDLYFTDKDGGKHEYNTNYLDNSKTLKNLKFKKTKSQNNDATEGRAGTSKSQETFSKENDDVNPWDTGRKQMSGKAENPHVRRSSSERYHERQSRPLHDKSPSPNRRVNPQRPGPSQENRPRPRPRPIPKPQVPDANKNQRPQRQPIPISDSSRGKVKEHAPSRNTAATAVKKKKPPSQDTIEISESSDDEEGGSTDSSCPFPTRRPVPQGFPTISPPLSPEARNSKPKRDTPKEIAAFPLSPLQARRYPSSDEAPSTSRKGLKAKGKKAQSRSKGFPAPSPLAKPVPRKGKHDQSRIILDDGDDDENVDSTPRPRAEPFPMSTQALHGSPSTPLKGAPKIGKRHSSGVVSDHEQSSSRKKRRDGSLKLYEDHYEEEDSIFISPDTDPRTLCPYCDTPLPSSPTALLLRLIEATAKKSHRDPRPANPLGRKAPFVTFIAICQRHRFESKILPEAEEKGWPKVIDWSKLEMRIGKMKDALQALIDDPGDEMDGIDGDEWDDTSRKRGPRSRSIFWCEVMKEVKTKGSRAAASVRGQFANFEKAQPGYYGELGSMIIHQTLFNLFPPTSFDPHLIAPMAANEFVQRVLVPEVALRLIMEDNKLKGRSGMAEAVQVLRDSSAYGVAMFPEDGGEWGATDGKRRKKKSSDLAAGDLIVMERARKRRKEIEEEAEREDVEAEAEAERVRLEELASSVKVTDKWKGKGKEKEKSFDDRIPPALPPRPRPKPRPVAKAVSKSGVNSQEPDEEDDLFATHRPRKYDTDPPTEPASDNNNNNPDSDDAGSVFGYTGKRFSRSPSASETGPQFGTQSQTITKSSTRDGGSVDMDLCSTSESEIESKSARRMTEPVKASRSVKPPLKEKEKSRSMKSMDVDVDKMQSSDSDSVIVTDQFSVKRSTGIARHGRRDNIIDLVDDDIPTPRATPKLPAAQNQPALSRASTSNLKPLEAARLRRQRTQDPSSTSFAQNKEVTRTNPTLQGRAHRRLGKDTWTYSMMAKYTDDGSGEEAEEDLSRPPSRAKSVKGRDSGYDWLLGGSSQSEDGRRGKR